MILGMTPRFTIRVWAGPGGQQQWDELSRLLGEPWKREPVAEIEIDTTEFDGELTISRHRGLDLIPEDADPRLDME